MGKDRESEVWVEGEKKEGLAGPVTWILFLSVSTCQNLVWTGLLSSRSQHKGFPLEETSCAEPTFSQSSAPHVFRLLLSYYQWVRLYGKQGGDWRGKVWHLFLTQHMCVYLKTVWRANRGLFLLMRARRRHTPDSPECEHLPGSGGGWIVGCDSHSVCLYCLRLHKGLLRTWSFHNSAYNVADKLVVGFTVC